MDQETIFHREEEERPLLAWLAWLVLTLVVAFIVIWVFWRVIQTDELSATARSEQLVVTVAQSNVSSSRDDVVMPSQPTSTPTLGSQSPTRTPEPTYTSTSTLSPIPTLRMLPKPVPNNPVSGTVLKLALNEKLTLRWESSLPLDGSLWFQVLITKPAYTNFELFVKEISNYELMIYFNDLSGYGDYSWRVRIAELLGTSDWRYGEWSQTYLFTLVAAPTPTSRPFPTPRPQSTPTTDLGSTRPILLIPNDNQQLDGTVTFSWKWPGGDLSDNLAFELRIWKDGQPYHYGAAEPVQTPSITINVASAFGISQGGPGTYNWTVIVVNQNPYEEVGVEAVPRIFTYRTGESSGGGGSDSPPDDSDRGTPPP